jgi:hypothetical protein
MVEQPAFASGCTALFDFPPEPFVVVHGAREQVQGDLIHRASGLLSQPGQLGCEFWRNLEIHEASVGCLDRSVNRRRAMARLSSFRPGLRALHSERLTPRGGRDIGMWLALAVRAVSRSENHAIGAGSSDTAISVVHSQEPSGCFRIRPM